MGMDAVEREDPETQKADKLLINYHFTLSMRYPRGSPDAKTSDCKTKLCIFSVCACTFPPTAPLGEDGLALKMQDKVSCSELHDQS